MVVTHVAAIFADCYDAEVDAAILKLKTRLPSAFSIEVDACLKEAAEIRGNRLPDANDHLVAPAGGSYVTKPKTLQGALSEIVDRSCVAGLLTRFNNE